MTNRKIDIRHFLLCERSLGGSSSPLLDAKNVGEAELINIVRRSGRSTSVAAATGIFYFL
jgi:hypothetical protein